MKIRKSILILISLSFSLLEAQETQVSIDREGKLFILNADLEKKLNLFSEFPNLIEARLFKAGEDEFTLEIIYGDVNQSKRAKRTLTAKGVEELRDRVSMLVGEKRLNTKYDHEGRVWMVLASAYTSLTFYGPAVPIILDVNEGKTAVALFMLTSATGILLPLQLTRERDVSDGQATLHRYGMSRGSGHGFLVGTLFLGDGISTRQGLAFAMAGSIGESLIAFSVADQYKFTGGKSEAIASTADFGLYAGLMSNIVIEPGNVRTFSATILAGAGAGIYAGHWLSEQQSYTRGDAYVMTMSGILGIYIPVAVVHAFHPKNEKTYAVSTTLGMIGGIGLGHQITRNKDFSFSQGLLIDLSTVAGGLTGFGLAYLVDARNDGTAYLLSGAAGAAAGYYFSYQAYSKAATVDKEVSWKMDVSPSLVTVPSKKSGMKNIPAINIHLNF